MATNVVPFQVTRLSGATTSASGDTVPSYDFPFLVCTVGPLVACSRLRRLLVKTSPLALLPSEDLLCKLCRIALWPVFDFASFLGLFPFFRLLRYSYCTPSGSSIGCTVTTTYSPSGLIRLCPYHTSRLVTAIPGSTHTPLFSGLSRYRS